MPDPQLTYDPLGVVIPLEHGGEFTFAETATGWRLTYDNPAGLHLSFPATDGDVRAFREATGMLTYNRLREAA